MSGTHWYSSELCLPLLSKFAVSKGWFMTIWIALYAMICPFRPLSLKHYQPSTEQIPPLTPLAHHLVLLGKEQRNFTL